MPLDLLVGGVYGRTDRLAADDHVLGETVTQFKRHTSYLEIEHAWQPTREKQMKRAVKDLDNYLRDLFRRRRLTPDDRVRIVSEPVFSPPAAERDWFRVVYVQNA